jgi:hypothetical protein
MTAFKTLYSVDSFKEAFETLLGLDEDDHPVVAAAVRADDRSELIGDVLTAATALRAMRAIAERESAEALLGDIEALCPPGTVEKLGDLVDVLFPTEDELEAEYAREVESLPLPVLTHPHIYVQLRPTPWRKSDEIKFVPIAVLRLNFDESVGASGEAIVFQSSLQMLSELRDSIDTAMDFVGRTIQALPAGSVPEYSLQWVEKREG